ncbi:MAG: class I SAM-dependent methyltransferase, partial [Acidobacteria bacterium]|nr:class I SAM-dependent methyltransferase [Acidobacteriota bacterium]
MHPNTYDNFSAVEETHWWFRHRRAVAREWLRRARVHHGVALDIGCGTGGNLPLLAEFARKVVGLDLSERALTL